MHVADEPAEAHAPPQPPICQPLPGVAVSVTFVPFGNVPVSLDVLVFVVIPDGLELTLPDPFWLKLSVRGSAMKLTDADRSEVIDTVHVVDEPAEAQAPPQPPTR